MSYLKVINYSTGDEQHPLEEFGEWSRDVNNNVSGLEIVSKENYYDVSTSFPVKKGDIVFLVWAEYTSGDSFGTSYGNISYIGVWKTKEKAEAAVEEIRRSANADKEDKDPKAVFILENGEIYEDGFPSWCGYFECLEAATCQPFIVS